MELAILSLVFNVVLAMTCIILFYERQRSVAEADNNFEWASYWRVHYHQLKTEYETETARLAADLAEMKNLLANDNRFPSIVDMSINDGKPPIDWSAEDAQAGAVDVEATEVQTTQEPAKEGV